MLTKFLGEHLVVKTHLKISLEMMMISSVEISGIEETKIVIIVQISKEGWIHLVWAEVSLMMMTSSVLALEEWVASRALHSLQVVWVLVAQA